MARLEFHVALRSFLRDTGHLEGGTSWFEKVFGHARYRTRWLIEQKLPSRGNWNLLVNAIMEEFQNDSDIRSKLAKLNDLYNSTRLERRGGVVPVRKRTTKLADTQQANVPQTLPDHDGPVDGSSDALYSHFLADTRIAAQLTSPSGNLSIYLDDVYVHRARTEKATLDAANQYLSQHGDRRGPWISVVGDAGHGKTSLLWYLAQELRHSCAAVYPVQSLQLASNGLRAVVEALSRHAVPFVFLLDTLDILTGADDASLAADLNAVRAAGGLLITTCRRQEIQALAKYVRSDQSLELARYEPDEARRAIERYVQMSYPEWSDGRNDLQTKHVWDLLDAQHRIQDISFEPLVLRMIFEAYVPDDIPPDINTQRVYDRFWETNVLSDRSSKSVEDAHARSVVSCQIATYLYFDAPTHTERISIGILSSLCKGIPHPLLVVEGLVSSGALRWWQTKALLGFFHQTFLEYVAAKSVLELVEIEIRRQRVDQLLADVERANLFRTPVLKQLMIQSSSFNRLLFDELCAAIAEVDTPVAVRLALEVLGKAQDPLGLHGIVLKWGLRQPELFRAVAPEVLRYFPAKRLDVAFEILAAHADDTIAGEVCYICAAFFAPMKPAETLIFLRSLWQNDASIFKSHEGSLKTALVAIFKAGEVAALDALVEILPRLSTGVQAGAYTGLSQAWSAPTASHAAAFLDKMFDTLAVSESNEMRAAFAAAFEALDIIAPTQSSSLILAFKARLTGTPNLRADTFLARIEGIAGPDDTVIRAAIQDLLGNDHIRRMCASDLLRSAARKGITVIDELLSLPSDTAFSPEVMIAIYTVVSDARDPQQMLAVLDRWTPTEHGAGTAYRTLMTNATKADPRQVLYWLKAQIPEARSRVRQRQVLIGFQMLAENAASTMTAEDIREFFHWGFENPQATDEMKRVFATAAGWIAEIDVGLSCTIFESIFKTRRRPFINAAIKSLRAVNSTELLLFAFDLTRDFTEDQGHYATFGLFLEVVADRSLDIRAALLQRLATPKSLSVIKAVDDAVAVSKLLTVLKSTVKADHSAVLELARCCPIIDEGNATTLSAVLDNACHQVSDPGEAREILGRLLDLAEISTYRVRNALRRALPRLDNLLPHREATNAVMATFASAKDWKPKALQHLARAAKNMGSWTRADSEVLLRSNLPPSVTAVLLS